MACYSEAKAVFEATGSAGTPNYAGGTCHFVKTSGFSLLKAQSWARPRFWLAEGFDVLNESHRTASTEKLPGTSRTSRRHGKSKNH